MNSKSTLAEAFDLEDLDSNGFIAQDAIHSAFQAMDEVQTDLEDFIAYYMYKHSDNAEQLKYQVILDLLEEEEAQEKSEEKSERKETEEGIGEELDDELSEPDVPKDSVSAEKDVDDYEDEFEEDKPEEKDPVIEEESIHERKDPSPVSSSANTEKEYKESESREGNQEQQE